MTQSKYVVLGTVNKLASTLAEAIRLVPAPTAGFLAVDKQAARVWLEKAESAVPTVPGLVLVMGGTGIYRLDV